MSRTARRSLPDVMELLPVHQLLSYARNSIKYGAGIRRIIFGKEPETMKVIFLDIDGVLNRQENGQDEVIEEEKVALLSGLIHQTGALLVLHSGWRFFFGESGKPLHPAGEKLIRTLKKHNLSLFGFTPDLSDETIRRTRRFSLVKAKEILLWLQRQETTVETYVILDDLNLKNAITDIHQVKINGKTGLTKRDIEKAAAILEGAFPIDSRP